MGTNIAGTIETFDGKRWVGQNDVYALGGGSRDAYSALFGTGFIPFEPLVLLQPPLPDDVSRRIRNRIRTPTTEFDDRQDTLSGAVLPYTMLDSVNWETQPDRRDRRYTVYDANGNPTGTKFSSAPATEQLSDQQEAALRAGEQVQYTANDGTPRFLVRERPTRRQALDDGWTFLVFELLPTYAARYGDENVRVVCWRE